MRRPFSTEQSWLAWIGSRINKLIWFFYFFSNLGKGLLGESPRKNSCKKNLPPATGQHRVAPMKARKTIEIETLKSRANFFLANSANEQTEQRKGFQSLAASLLMDAGAYRGFRYLTERDVSPGDTFGITHGAPPVMHDETRVELF